MNYKDNKDIVWVYGKCGYGKTTFVNETIKEFKKENKKVYKISGEELIRKIIKILQSKSVKIITDYLNYLKEFDLLVIDSLSSNNLHQKPATQTEIKWLVRGVVKNNKAKVILVSQEEPKNFKKLLFEESYCNYFKLKAPTTKFKLKLIKKWAQKENIYLSEFVMEELAIRTNNLFKLKGLFNQITCSMKLYKEKAKV